MRVITPQTEHVFAWVELVKRFLDEGIGKYNWGLNEEHLHKTYHAWDKESCGWLLEDEGEIVGVLAGILNVHFFNHDNIIFLESMWYVLPEYRKKGGGLLLYRACVKKMKELGVNRLIFGHTREMINEFEELYDKLGFTYLETHYEKVL